METSRASQEESKAPLNIQHTSTMGVRKGWNSVCGRIKGNDPHGGKAIAINGGWRNQPPFRIHKPRIGRCLAESWGSARYWILRRPVAAYLISLCKVDKANSHWLDPPPGIQAPLLSTPGGPRGSTQRT